MARTIAYLRVSKADQDVDKFRADVLQFAMERDFGQVDFVQEKVTGKTSWKERKLFDVINGLETGDRLIVPELSRLGRSSLEILEIMQVAKNAGACIYAVKGGWQLDDSIQGKIIAHVMAMMAEIERDLISERTREALAARQRKSEAGETWISKSGRECRKLGRRPGPGKSKLDQYADEIEALLTNGATKTYVAKRYDTSIQNLSNWLRKHGHE